MTNVNTAVKELAPIGGSTNRGLKFGLLEITAKAAQNDTVTITNADEIVELHLVIDATGASEPYTLSDNVITATSATTGSVRGIVVFR